MTLVTVSGRDCLHAWETMPWILPDRAAYAQGEWLHGHVAQCTFCHAAFEQQRRLRFILGLPARLPINADVGLRRLLARLDASAQPPGHVPARTGWMAQGLFAAVLIQTVGLAALGGKLWPSILAPAYHTLGEEPVPVAAGTIRVVPEAAMPLADWNALLHVLQLRVVGGPDATGAYTVAPVSAAASTRHTLQQLRAIRGIHLAEPLSGLPR